MPCVVAAGSWAPSRPVTKRDSSARRSHLRQPGHAHLPCVTADSPRDGCIFGGWRRFLTPGCWLLTGTGSGVPPLRTRLLRDCSLPGAHGLGAPGLAAEAARLPALTAWSPPWRGTGRRRAHPAASPKRTRAAHGLLPVAVATTRAGRLPTRPGGAACLCIFLTSLVKFILWNSGRA